MYKFFKYLYNKLVKKKACEAEFSYQFPPIDPVMEECITRALQTGNIVVGNVKDGKVVISEITKKAE